MGRACTSTIKVVHLPDGKCEVDMCYTHYGHETQIQHCKLSKRQKQSIAIKVQQGVAFDRILDDVCDDVPTEDSSLREERHPQHCPCV